MHIFRFIYSFGNLELSRENVCISSLNYCSKKIQKYLSFSSQSIYTFYGNYFVPGSVIRKSFYFLSVVTYLLKTFFTITSYRAV